MSQSFASIRVENIIIPTYPVGKPDKNPMFLERRVYQGSSGKVYPYPVIDSIGDEKSDVEYEAVILENEYIEVTVLPCFGGRIQWAKDKTNGYDFVYRNEVIKPALVGLLGPWISGGIEFNWPQHHRPTTYMPVSYEIKHNDDGSVSLVIGDTDEMYGTVVETTFTVYPGRAYIEIGAKLFNRTSLPQTFLWWANPAVSVNDDTQSVFPPDVNAVFDHGKRDVSKFPIATGVYYKHDYGAGVDISRYRNIPVPTSYMAYKSTYDFVGGYDYGKKAGILHFADHHISPGKKQWTWGCGDFGKAWDRNLTDENGPYIELMTGVFTDNQPDFTWLMPFEEKSFKQYFMPYKGAGYVKNANLDAALNFERSDDGIHIIVSAMRVIQDAAIVLSIDGKDIWEKKADLSPDGYFEDFVQIKGKYGNPTLSLYDRDKNILIEASEREKKLEQLPEPAEKVKAPSEIMTNEELYLIGEHLEQYRHATFDPDDYYKEALKRDALDIRVNNAYGKLLLRRCDFTGAEELFRNALKRLTLLTPNPYTGEPFFNLGLSLFYQGREDEAYDSFYKATWSESEKSGAFYYLAAIAKHKGEYDKALSFIDESLARNARNYSAKSLKVYILEGLGDAEGARRMALETIKDNPFCFASAYYLMRIGAVSQDVFRDLMNDRPVNYLNTAFDFSIWGNHEEAADILSLSPSSPSVAYAEAYEYQKAGLADKSKAALEKARSADLAYCFPSSIYEYIVLSSAINVESDDPSARYLRGNLLYDKKRYDEAYEDWRISAEADPSFPTVFRNLSIVLYNKRSQKEEALKSLEMAYSLDEEDARVLLELDQLKEKLGYSAEDRLSFLEAHMSIAERRDDLYISYITLLNYSGRYEEAFSRIASRKFHPWEGGEGKVTAQYKLSLKNLAFDAISSGDFDRAIELLSRALTYPDNLGEGKLEGTKDNDIHYLLGICLEKCGREKEAQDEFLKGIEGTEELASALYYNDQPADMALYQGLCRRKLGDDKGAKKRFNAMADFGEKHYFDEIKFDYFAVSLPDLQLWDDDLTRKNKAHCLYLIALGALAEGDRENAAAKLEEVLRIDPYHSGARTHLQKLDILLKLFDI